MKVTDYASVFQRILNAPAAPFREKHVMKALHEILTEGKVPHFFDSTGNIVVGAKDKTDYLKLIRRKSKEPVRIFIAHMDHPGFHFTKKLSETRYTFKWFGGSPTAHLEGANVWLADSEGPLGEGKILLASLKPSGRAIDQGEIEIAQLARDIKKPADVFGGFHFREFLWKENDLYLTKAADDLVGVFAIVALALKLWERKRPEVPFLGLLTRAEEVGFIGAIGHLELGWWKKARRPLVAVSLETSRTLPGALIGSGPVVRLGDRMGVFHSGGTHLLSQLAQKVLPGKHQRRIMDGGTCEGTAATAYGIPTIALSVPLGNYHNQSLEGGTDAAPENGPAPEFVHESDVDGLMQLTWALMQRGLHWEDPLSPLVANFRKEFKNSESLLRSGMARFA